MNTPTKNTFENYSREVYTTTPHTDLPISTSTTLAEDQFYQSDYYTVNPERNFLLKWQSQFGVRYDFGKKQRYGIRLFAETSFASRPSRYGFSDIVKYGKLGLGTFVNI